MRRGSSFTKAEAKLKRVSSSFKFTYLVCSFAETWSQLSRALFFLKHYEWCICILREILHPTFSMKCTLYTIVASYFIFTSKLLLKVLYFINIISPPLWGYKNIGSGSKFNTYKSELFGQSLDFCTSVFCSLKWVLLVVLWREKWTKFCKSALWT